MIVYVLRYADGKYLGFGPASTTILSAARKFVSRGDAEQKAESIIKGGLVRHIDVVPVKGRRTGCGSARVYQVVEEPAK